MNTPTRPPGRPPRDPRGRNDSVIVLKVRHERKAGYVKAAQSTGKTLAGFMLDASDRAAIETLNQNPPGRNPEIKP